MGEQHIALFLLKRAVRPDQIPKSARKDIIEWYSQHTRMWNWPTLKSETWSSLKKVLKDVAPCDQQKDPTDPLVIAARVAKLMNLGPRDTQILEAVTAIDAIGRIDHLFNKVAKQKWAKLDLLIALTGVKNRVQLTDSLVFQTGLATLCLRRRNSELIEISDVLERALGISSDCDEELIETLVGRLQAPVLDLSDFSARRPEIAIILDILRGALKTCAKGVNILIHGPPGVGKTELARTLSGTLQASLFACGECDEYGSEPTRWERLDSYSIAQRLLVGRQNALLLFDEMEDMIGDVSWGSGSGWQSRREGSKVFLNRLFEQNAVPTLWTSNSIENVDPAYLRRMSYVFHFESPTGDARRSLIANIAKHRGVALSDRDVRSIADLAPESASVAASAFHAAALAGREGDDTLPIFQSLATALRYGKPLPRSGTGREGIDLGLYNLDADLTALTERLARPGAAVDFSLLMSGPPGTGKTALAAHIAERIGRPLIVQRTSDLLSKWVGESEQKIAAAFKDAECKKAVLFFDEVDSILFDRGKATQPWQVSQINELLTWLEPHPYPVIAATNALGALDPAALRRFDIKLTLRPLNGDQAAAAFERFFDRAPPRDIRDIRGLTPGDFAAVKKRIRFEAEDLNASAVLTLLAQEVSLKPSASRKIGFGA